LRNAIKANNEDVDFKLYLVNNIKSISISLKYIDKRIEDSLIRVIRIKQNILN